MKYNIKKLINKDMKKVDSSPYDEICEIVKDMNANGTKIKQINIYWNIINEPCVVFVNQNEM